MALISRPLVSIITPSLNQGDRLSRCIESVASQTYERVEHLVIDGGSTDQTVEVLSQFETVKWVSEQDNGQTEALNKGFRLAVGDILTWLNADDVLFPDAIDIAVAALREDRFKGWMYGSCEVVAGATRVVWKPAKGPSPTTFPLGGGVPQQGMCFTRSAWELVGELDETFDLTMDIDWILRAAHSAVPSRRVNAVLATFEVHPNSKTGSRPPHEFMEEEVRAICKHDEPQLASLAMGWAVADRMAFLQGPSGDLRQFLISGESFLESLGVVPDRSAMRNSANMRSAQLQAASGLFPSRAFLPGPWLLQRTRRGSFDALGFFLDCRLPLGGAGPLKRRTRFFLSRTRAVVRAGREGRLLSMLRKRFLRRTRIASWRVLRSQAHNWGIKIFDSVRLRIEGADLIALPIFLGEFEVAEQTFVSSYLRPGDTFLDIGAHVGLFSLRAGVRVAESGAVHAFEPNSHSYELLKKNILENRFKNIHPHKLAMSDVEGDAPFWVIGTGLAAFSTFGHPIEEAAAQSECVPTATLDSWLAQAGLDRVDLIKIDAEGWEGRIIAGAENLLCSQDSPTLLVEFSEDPAQRAGSTCDALRSQLIAMGYKLYRFDEGRRTLAPIYRDHAWGWDNLIATKDLRSVYGRLRLGG